MPNSIDRMTRRLKLCRSSSLSPTQDQVGPIAPRTTGCARYRSVHGPCTPRSLTTKHLFHILCGFCGLSDSFSCFFALSARETREIKLSENVRVQTELVHKSFWLTVFWPGKCNECIQFNYGNRRYVEGINPVYNEPIIDEHHAA